MPRLERELLKPTAGVSVFADLEVVEIDSCAPA
jgi:hypothetical protein